MASGDGGREGLLPYWDGITRLLRLLPLLEALLDTEPREGVLGGVIGSSPAASEVGCAFLAVSGASGHVSVMGVGGETLRFWSWSVNASAVPTRTGGLITVFMSMLDAVIGSAVYAELSKDLVPSECLVQIL